MRGKEGKRNKEREILRVGRETIFNEWEINFINIMIIVIVLIGKIPEYWIQNVLIIKG